MHVTDLLNQYAVRHDLVIVKMYTTEGSQRGPHWYTGDRNTGPHRRALATRRDRTTVRLYYDPDQGWRKA